MDEADSMLRSGHIQEGMDRLIPGMNNKLNLTDS